MADIPLLVETLDISAKVVNSQSIWLIIISRLFMFLILAIIIGQQWNLSIMDTLGPDIFGQFLLQYKCIGDN